MQYDDLDQGLKDALSVEEGEPIKKAFNTAAFAQELRSLAENSPYTWEAATLDRPGGLERPIFHKSAPKPTSPSLLITTGIHGNEPAGPLAVKELLSSPAFRDLEVVIVPMVNPVGLEAGKRGGPGNQVDLNRDFALNATEETRNLVEFYRSIGKFTAVISPHEDWGEYKDAQGVSQGAYIYELNRDGGADCTPEIEAALQKAGMPQNRMDNIDGLATENGLIKRTGIASEAPPKMSMTLDKGLVAIPMTWVEAKETETSVVRELDLTNLAYIVETPSWMPLETRVAAHKKVVTAIAEKLSDPSFRPVQPEEERHFDLHAAIQSGKLSTVGLPRPLYGEQNHGLYTLPLDIDHSNVKDILSADQIADDRKKFEAFKTMVRRSSEIEIGAGEASQKALSI